MNISSAGIMSALMFDNYTVDSLEFRANPAYSGKSVTIVFELDHDISLDQSRADVTLHLKLFPDAAENDYPFEMSVRLTGHFQVAEDLQEAETLVKLNTLSILFPYLRALVTTITSNCNVPPLILPPVNVHKVLGRSE